MKILFDQGTPSPLRHHPAEHAVDTAFENGWSELENGDLLDAAEGNAYELLIKTDRNVNFQQNLSGRRLAILVLLSRSWPRIRLRIDEIVDAVDRIAPEEYVESAI